MGTPAATTESGGISLRLLGFLQDHFGKPEDLATIQSLTFRLKQECGDRELELLQLKKRLSLAVSSWISQSNDVGTILRGIEHGHPCAFQDGNVRSHEKILLVELPLIAKEVGRIQSVKFYAETVLRLETLVGDLEDAALSMMKQVSRRKFENIVSKASNLTVTQDNSNPPSKLLVALKAMKEIEEILGFVANSRPWWTNLPKAVDCRVDKALAILRQQCLTDYRTQIASLGWPPSLSTSNVEKDDCLEIQNPFFLMKGESKSRYSQTFLALCSLQQLQAKRESRSNLLRENHTSSDPTGFNGLWPINELVNPIALRMEYHFSRWSDQPEFIFALVYKITQNFSNGVENMLQPLIDKARLSGCSAKEAWVVAMIRTLSAYLERRVFPALFKNYSIRDSESERSSSLLQMVDLMIAFTKRMKTLSASGTLASIECFASSLSIMAIFNEHSDWLQMWAEMEVRDAEEKLKPQLEDEGSWMKEYESPLMAESVLDLAWGMMERGLALPCGRRRKQFISSSAIVFLSNFFCALLERGRDVELMDSVSDDAPLLRKCSAVNAACYCEHALHGWTEDVNLMEMFASGDDDDDDGAKGMFGDGMMFLAKLRTDCLEEIATALLVCFGDLCRDYVRDGERWAAERAGSDYGILDEDYLFVSPSFIEALDMLRDRIGFLNLNLNFQSFVDLWRSVAGGLDHFIFGSIPTSDARFSSMGVYQFRTDMKAIFLIFKPFCARPEAFFPCTGDCLKLLEISDEDADMMLEVLSQGHGKSEDWLRRHGLVHVSPAQAEKVLRNRMFRAMVEPGG